MSHQRKLLAVLIAVAVGLALLIVLALRRPGADARHELAREAEPPPPAPRPSEPIDADAGRSALATASETGPAAPVQPAHQPGPPVKIVGRIGDGKGTGLDAVDVLVYDSRGEEHKPEVLRPDWYECTLHERGRTLVVASRDEHCTAEAPLEVLPPDIERHVDLVLPPRPVLRIHVRDPQGKPLPRIARGQPLRAQVRAVASVEDLPERLPAPMVKPWSSTDPQTRPSWADFEPQSLLQLLSTRGGFHLPGAPRGREQRSRGRSDVPWTMRRALEWDPENVDDARFDEALAKLRGEYKQRLETEGRIEESDVMRRYLAALGYLGEDGTPIEGESPERDVVGTLTLARPLPLHVSLLAGQRVLETRDPVPWTEDLSFTVEFERLNESYVHAYLFVSDAQSGARLPGATANLQIEPLAGGPEQPPEMSRSIARGYAGQEAPASMGAPKGWRFPETDVRTDADGRADFLGALAGWCKLTVKADGHVPLTKWIDVERGAESNLGFFALAPLATSLLTVLDPAGAGARVRFELWPQLHAKDCEGTLDPLKFESDDGGLLVLEDIGRQQLLLRSVDSNWALEPLVLDNTQGLVDSSALHVTPARHVLLHLPANLPLAAIVNVAQGLTRSVYEECHGGQTLIHLWLADGTYTLRVSTGFTALLTLKFTVDGEPLLVECAP